MLDGTLLAQKANPRTRAAIAASAPTPHVSATAPFDLPGGGAETVLAGAVSADTVLAVEVVAESLWVAAELALVVVTLVASPPQSAG
jgi:hypothetical protein